MNTVPDVQFITRTNNYKLVSQLRPEARQLLTLGQKRGWDFAILGQAPLPREHIRMGDWLIVPAHHDTSAVPPRALERVQSIFAAGIRPKGFVVVHEAPKLLSASQEVDTTPKPGPSVLPNLTPALKVAGGALGTLAVLTLGIGGLAVALVAGAALALPAILLAGAVALDPILIVVTEDDIWIEIDRWTVS